MTRNQRPLPHFENVEVIDAGSEGKAVARVGDLVIFVPFVVPGDVIDIQVIRKKRSFCEGKVTKIHTFSLRRAEPFCDHFGICGGCKWQHVKYEDQLFYKQKQVEDSLVRIGKISAPEILPIIASEKKQYYRNKLEYTFSNRRWLTESDVKGEVPEKEMNALGFHIPGLFDKVLDIRKCYLQGDPSNDIRLFVRNYALSNNLSFYDVRNWTGLLRNIIIRNTSTGDLMVIVVFREELPEVILPMLNAIINEFPVITSLFYVINPKKNDTLGDLEFRHFSGLTYMTESMPSFKGGQSNVIFRIGPASFYQTNSYQAVNLYQTTASFAGLTGTETVYDLYTGTGTIANFIATSAGTVVGIESVAPAIADARINSQLNGFKNTRFFAGEAEKILTPEFILENGSPEIIITDPPRSGMHEKVIRMILEIKPRRIVYVSCNPATQARDLLILSEAYRHIKSQPVDMFPHTQHVENVALLELISQ